MNEEVDFRRPATPLPPRVPAWLILTLLWTVGFVIAYLLSYFDAEPNAPGSQLAVIVLLIAFLVATSIAFVSLRGGRERVFINPYWRGQAYPQDDPSDPERFADRQEIEARHRLRHGTISRATYERIVARRQFVHGDISLAEYHERVREIAEREEVSSPDSSHKSG